MQLLSDRRGMKQFEGTASETPEKSLRAICVALLSAMLFAVCAAPVFAQEPVGKDLKMFFQQNCARCHGPDGSAISAEGKKLHGQDLTDPDWQRRSRDDEMVKTILNGKFFGIAMPGFKAILTGDEVQRIVTDIIRKSKKGQVIVPGAARPVGK